MKSYRVMEEHLSSPEIGDYVTYGIELDGILLASDVSTERTEVTGLTEDMNEGDLDPVHVADVVADFLACC